MNEAEMVNGAGRIERTFPGVRCDWRQAEGYGWGIAIYDEHKRYICTIFSAGLVRDIEKVAMLLGLAGVAKDGA